MSSPALAGTSIVPIALEMAGPHGIGIFEKTEIVAIPFTNVVKIAAAQALVGLARFFSPSAFALGLAPSSTPAGPS